MKRQLVLIPGHGAGHDGAEDGPQGLPAHRRRPVPWRLDERTRRIGLEGVASARQALHAAGERVTSDHSAA